MRVLLVRPPSALGRMSRQNLQHPTNIVGLASELNARGHRASVLDLEIAPGGIDALEPALQWERPDVCDVSEGDRLRAPFEAEPAERAPLDRAPGA